MRYNVRELRDATGLTQKAFAELFDIPLSTLRKWEQGDASPAPYVLRLIAAQVPAADQALEMIEGSTGERFYYNQTDHTVSDALGNIIKIHVGLEKVKRQNLVLYLEDLFHDYYEIREKFEKDCMYDLKEDILWVRGDS